MGRDRRRVGKPLKRRVGTRQPRKTLLVFCEGRRTEPDYLHAVKREPAVRKTAAVDIRIHTGTGGSTPLGLVTMAVEAHRRSVAEEGEIDEFWCVFDVEWPRNHPTLLEAMEQATRHGINVAVSNPCFELWLVLHFQECGAWLDNDEVQRLRRRCDSAAGKGIDAATYMPRRYAAAQRAGALDARHEVDGTRFPDNNPSSGMYRLLASVEQTDPSVGRSARQ